MESEMIQVKIPLEEQDKKEWLTQFIQIATSTAKKIAEYCHLQGCWTRGKLKKIDVFSWLLNVMAVILAGTNLGIGILFYEQREDYYHVPSYLIVSGASFTVISVLFSLVNCRDGLCFCGLWVFFGFVHCVYLFLEVITFYILWFSDQTAAAGEGHVAPSQIEGSFLMTSAFILANVGLLYTLCTLLCLCIYNRKGQGSRPSNQKVDATELIMFKHTAIPSRWLIEKGCKSPLMSNV